VSNWYTVQDGERNVRVAVIDGDNSTWVFFEGNVWRIDKQQAAGGRKAKSRGDGSVMSPMPATVVAINTSAGKAVNEGDTVIVLEAMKMELPIKAPRGGVVKAVHCTKGELVQPGVNLVEIE
jgi:acetyl/propionyl-CoA carboxylase alpha subunit